MLEARRAAELAGLASAEVEKLARTQLDADQKKREEVAARKLAEEEGIEEAEKHRRQLALKDAENAALAAQLAAEKERASAVMAAAAAAQAAHLHSAQAGSMHPSESTGDRRVAAAEVAWIEVQPVIEGGGERIGGGGFSDVFSGRWRGRDVAVKLLMVSGGGVGGGGSGAVTVTSEMRFNAEVCERAASAGFFYVEAVGNERVHTI